MLVSVESLNLPLILCVLCHTQVRWIIAGFKCCLAQLFMCLSLLAIATVFVPIKHSLSGHQKIFFLELTLTWSHNNFGQTLNSDILIAFSPLV